jgi:MFS family permease
MRRVRLYSGNLLVLGLASLLTDASSEMIVPLLPLFLVGTLGAGPAAVGLIEGTAEATAALFKAFSGWWSDRTGRRKPLVVAGYSLSTLARPLVGLAPSWPFVYLLRFFDRVGKGIRTAPRDALLAHSVPAERRGEAFGFHRAMDHAGAVIGPLVAAALIPLFAGNLRPVFLLAAIPGIGAVAVLAMGIRERDETPAEAPLPAETEAAPRAPLPRAYWRALVLFTFLALAQASDAFLLLRASAAGVATMAIPILWAGFHVVKAFASQAGGLLSDRFGRKPVLCSGWLLYSASYFLFAEARSALAVVGVFALYGLHFGAVEGVEKALIADLVPAPSRGRAFGFFHGATGFALLPASWLFGAIWSAASPELAFRIVAGVALVGALAIPFVLPPHTPAAEPELR